jgi:hypothetical protein
LIAKIAITLLIAATFYTAKTSNFIDIAAINSHRFRRLFRYFQERHTLRISKTAFDTAFNTFDTFAA